MRRVLGVERAWPMRVDGQRYDRPVHIFDYVGSIVHVTKVCKYDEENDIVISRMRACLPHVEYGTLTGMYWCDDAPTCLWCVAARMR